MAFWNKLVTTISKDGGAPAKERLKPEDFRRPQRLKEGFIWAETMIRPRPCTIRQLSPLTAEVVLWNEEIKPSLLRGELKFFSSADGKEADCVVASRNGNTLSLRITTAFRAPTRSYA